MKNNFDTSSTGVNLELSCFYDNDLSRIYFEDDIERIGKWRDDKFFFICSWQYSMDGMYIVGDKEAFKKAFEEEYHVLEENEKLEDQISNYELDDDFPGVVEKYPSVEIRWYSQWDYAKVYYDPACLNEHFTEKVLREHLHHIFYDAPIYCRLTIDGEEICFEEQIKDMYTYDRDEILELAKTIEHEKKEYILQWLSENLPKNPDYM